MDIVEAIKTRKSIRAFKLTPVPKKVLEEVLTIALRAPSWADTQPWEFAVVGGQPLEEIRKRMVEKDTAGQAGTPDIPSPEFGEPYNTRRRSLGMKLFEHLGIAREDRDKRRQWGLQGVSLFGAPNAVIFYLDRSLGPWSILDTGILLQTFMLAACAKGLGTCAMAQLVRHPDVLRNVLQIPESKLIVVGVAVGYPDEKALPNHFTSPREPLESFATWHGVE